MGFPCGSAGKESPAMWETWVWSLGWEDTLEEGKVGPLQYSGLENSMDSIVCGVAESKTWLSDFHLIYVDMYTFGRTKANFCLSFYSEVWKFQRIREVKKNHRTDAYAPITKMKQMLECHICFKSLFKMYKKFCITDSSFCPMLTSSPTFLCRSRSELFVGYLLAWNAC